MDLGEPGANKRDSISSYWLEQVRSLNFPQAPLVYILRLSPAQPRLREVELKKTKLLTLPNLSEALADQIHSCRVARSRGMQWHCWGQCHSISDKREITASRCGTLTTS